MNRKWLLAALLVAPGCGGRSAARPASADKPDGGVVLVFAEPEGVVFDVDLYSKASAGLVAMPQADGVCRVTRYANFGEDSITVDDLDLGPTVTMTLGTTDVVAPAANDEAYADGFNGRLSFPGDQQIQVVHEGTPIEYSAGVAGVDGFGASVTLFNQGAADGLDAEQLASVVIPGEIDPLQPPVNGSVVPGKPFPVEWTGGVGAAIFHVFAEGLGAHADCFVPSTQSSLVIPADVTAQLGDDAFATVDAETWLTTTIGGRDVLVVVGSDNLD